MTNIIYHAKYDLSSNGAIMKEGQWYVSLFVVTHNGAQNTTECEFINAVEQKRKLIAEAPTLKKIRMKHDSVLREFELLFEVTATSEYDAKSKVSEFVDCYIPINFFLRTIEASNFNMPF